MLKFIESILSDDKQASIICEMNGEQIEDVFWRNAVREFNIPWK